MEERWKRSSKHRSEAVVKTVVKSQEALGSSAWNKGGALEEKVCLFSVFFKFFF
jgi:hypothetical protein